ncbi:hypothetical protein P3H15_12485 [Rhodococcus sp. T2V]|nr:hypothetical protein [Rhodococcus sp. T2V]
MRGVSGDEDPSYPELVGDDALHHPRADLVDLDGVVGGEAEGGEHPLEDLLLAHGVGVVVRVLHVEDPLLRGGSPVVGSHRDQDTGPRAAEVGVDQPADEHVVVGGPLREVRGHVHRDELHDVARAVEGDPDLLADGAAAVGGDDVLRPHGVLAVGILVADGRGDAAVVLDQVEEFVVEAHVAGIELLGVVPEDRLQANLWQVAGAARAGRDVVGVGVAAAPHLQHAESLAVVLVLAGESGVPAGGAHVLGGRAALIDLGCHTGLGEDLHRALVEHVRLRKLRRGRQRAHQQRLDAEGGQGHRRGQSGASTADDQDGNFDDGHGGASSGWVRSVRRPSAGE